MATPIGVNNITALVDRYLIPQIVDNVYSSNPLIFRLIQNKKKIVRGGTQIEQPVIMSDFNVGGFYQGLEELEMAPQNTTVTAAWDWKFCYVPLMFAGPTLVMTDSPDAIANLVQAHTEQASMRMAELLGTAIYQSGGNTGGPATITSGVNSIDGIQAAVDDATVATNYGSLSRSTYTNWKAPVDRSLTSLTLPNLNTAFTQAQVGGRTPSIIVSKQGPYNKYYNLAYGSAMATQYNVSAGSIDQQTFAGGFSGLLFNGRPWIVDSHVPVDPSSGKDPIFMLNEDVWSLVVSNRADMYMEPFQTPITQDAVAAKILWAGNLICSSPRLNGGLLAIA